MPIDILRLRPLDEMHSRAVLRKEGIVLLNELAKCRPLDVA